MGRGFVPHWPHKVVHTFRLDSTAIVLIGQQAVLGHLPPALRPAPQQFVLKFCTFCGTRF